MKLLHTIAVILLLIGFSSVAHARKPQIKFYNFDEMLIDGEIKKPKGLLTDVRGRAGFKRLNDMRRSFLKELEATAHEKTIK